MNKNNLIFIIILGFFLIYLGSQGVFASEDVTISESNGDLICEAQDMSIFAATGWRWFREDGNNWIEVDEDKTRDISDPYPNSLYTPDETANYRCEVYAGDVNWNNYNPIGFNEIHYESPYDIENSELTVRSRVDGSLRSGASISRVSGTSGMGGTTHYTKTHKGDIDVVLRAPSTHNGADFSHWSGCDNTLSTRRCSISVDSGDSKSITAHFETPVDPVDGVCGSEDGKVYSFDDSSWDSSDFCEVGDVNPSNPSFPSAGDSTSWSCLGEDGGDDASCSASREDMPDGALSGSVNYLELSCHSTYSLWATTGWRWFRKSGSDWVEISSEKERKTSTSINVDDAGDYKCAIYFSDRYWDDYIEGDSLVLTAIEEPRDPIEIISIDVIGDLKVGNEVKFTSEVINYDVDSVEFSWYINNDYVSSSDSFNYIFEESGNYDVTLKVSDDYSNDEKTISVSVDVLDFSVDTSYYEYVISGNDQVLSFHVTDDEGDVESANVEISGDRSGSCVTSFNGGCNIRISEDDEGDVSLTYTVSKENYESVSGSINYEVLSERYEIHELNTFSDSDYSVIEAEFFRGDDFYLSFLVWDIIEEEYIVPGVSEAYLVGDGDRKELDFDGVNNDYLRFNTAVPLTDHFLGESFSVVFAFDLDYSYGGQEEIEVFLKNNPPFVISDLNDFSMNFGSTKSINLDNHFRDREDNALGYTLTYDFIGCSNQDVSVDDNNLVIEAKSVETCSLEVTATDRNGASVSSSFDLTVIEDSFDLDVNYFSRVIEGHNQTVTFSASDSNEPLSGVEVSLFGLDDVKSCTTGSNGGCNIKYVADEVGDYDLSYEASLIGYESVFGSINYEVIPERYEIRDLNSFSDSGYTLEENAFALGDDLYISFRVWDFIEEEYIIPEVSEAYLVGDGVREKLDKFNIQDDFIQFHTEIPYDDKFLGESFSVVFAFDYDYSYGGQKELPIYIYDGDQSIKILSPKEGEKLDERTFDLKYDLRSRYNIPTLDFYVYDGDNLLEKKSFAAINGIDSKRITLSEDYLTADYQNFTFKLSLRGHKFISDSVNIQIRDEVKRRLEESRKQNIRLTRVRPEIVGDNICVNLVSDVPMKSRTEVTFSIRELGLSYRNVVRSGNLESYCFDFPGFPTESLSGELLRIDVKNRGDHEIYHRII